ncbi:hypothetical protein GQ457_02G030270 [Hibiscus cannabinus]
MEVHITSKQIIKPSSSELHLLEPFKLSFLDQFSIRMYTPVILFYAKPSGSNIDGSQFLDQLKQSLSKALTQFYAAAGRLKNNLFITDFNEGVPYVEARVAGSLSDFIEQTEKLEAMNRLLPCPPYRYIQDPTTPQLAVQVNIFDCGGIALALCFFHKIFDGTTVYAFLNSWAAFSRGSNGEIPNPELLGASSQLFPPIESMLESAALKSLIFNDGPRKMTKSFVFDANAITTLVLKAKSKSLGIYSVPNDPQVVLQGFKTMIKLVSHAEEMVSKGDVEWYLLSSWLNTLDGNEDFGWGESTLFSIPGIDSQNREMRNLMYLKNARQHRAIEAWVSLSEKEMGFLERDAHFLAFASPNSYSDKSKI